MELVQCNVVVEGWLKSLKSMSLMVREFKVGVRFVVKIMVIW